MGLFTATIGAGHVDGGDMVEVSALVDAGAYHTILPTSLLERLQVRRLAQQVFEFANGYEEPLGVGLACIAWQDKEFPCPVVFGAEDKHFLGASTLESLNLMVGPRRNRLVPFIHPERPYLEGR